MLKRLWQLHSWIGLICGAGLLVIGLTGTLLVFHDEIEALLHPRMLAVTPTAAGRLPLDRLVVTMQQAFPDYEITTWIIRREPQWADVVYVVRHGETEIRLASIDPYRGDIRAGPIGLNQTFTGWMLDLHYKFFIGKIGVVITGTMAVLLCFLGLSGLWLYRSFWKNLFRLRWNRSARIFFSDFHKMIGISSVIMNLILGMTGAYFNTVEIKRDLQGVAEIPQARGPFYSGRISFDSLLSEARQRLPGFDPTYFALPVAPNGSIFIAGKISKQSSIRSDYGSSVTFDANTGAFQQGGDIRQAGALTQILDTVVPLHFGTFGGLPIKILWCFAGLAPGFLAMSGFLIWRSRTKTKKESGRPKRPELTIDNR